MGQTAVVISKQIGHTYVTKYLFCNSLPLPAQCYLLLLCNMYVFEIQTAISLQLKR